MKAFGGIGVGDLSLDEVGRGLWERALPQLAKALDGDEGGLLAVLGGTARDAGLGQSIPVSALLEAYSEGCRQVRTLLIAAGGPDAEAANRRLMAIEHVALTRIAAGYSAGLEETISRLRSAARESSTVDEDTGAMKPDELHERLSLEVNRCQRMDLSLGLVELAVDDDADAKTSGARQGHREALREIGDCLRDNLRRYDSIGLTPEGAFLLVLPDISRRGLAGAAERLRREIGECGRRASPQDLVLALSHYDYVDASATEMLSGLEHGLREARSAREPLAWA